MQHPARFILNINQMVFSKFIRQIDVINCSINWEEGSGIFHEKFDAKEAFYLLTLIYNICDRHGAHKFLIDLQGLELDLLLDFLIALEKGHEEFYVLFAVFKVD